MAQDPAALLSDLPMLAAGLLANAGGPGRDLIALGRCRRPGGRCDRRQTARIRFKRARTPPCRIGQGKTERDPDEARNGDPESDRSPHRIAMASALFYHFFFRLYPLARDLQDQRARQANEQNLHDAVI